MISAAGATRPLDTAAARSASRPMRIFLQCRLAAILQPMKATLTITHRGAVTLTAKRRRAMGLKADDLLIAETPPDGLLLRPAFPLPHELHTDERVAEHDRAEAELGAFLDEHRAG